MTWNTNSSLYDPTKIWGTDYTNNVSGPQINNANNQAANSGDFNFGNFMLNNPVGDTLDDFGPQNINAGPQVNDTNNGLLQIPGINNQINPNESIPGINNQVNPNQSIPGINNQVNPAQPFTSSFNNPYMGGDSLIGANTQFAGGFNPGTWNNLNLPQYMQGDQLYGSGDPLGGAGGGQDAFGNASYGNLGYTMNNPFTGHPMTIGQFDYGGFGRDNYVLGDYGGLSDDGGGVGGGTVTATPGTGDDDPVDPDDTDKDIADTGGFNVGRFGSGLLQVGQSMMPAAHQYNLYGSGQV